MRNRTINCIFGTGKIATGEGLSSLHYLNIPIHYFCDNNPERWGKSIIEDIICLSPSELERLKNVKCYLLMSPGYCDEVEQQLLLMGIVNIVRVEEILYNDRIIDRFYAAQTIHTNLERKSSPREYTLPVVPNKNRKKVAIYTCITGNYDQITEPIYVDNEAFDYYLISEEQPKQKSVFQWLNLNAIVPENVENDVRRNRYCKILGNELFSEYEYSIYIDGNMCICQDITNFLECVGSHGIAMFRHVKYKDCIYIEGVDCIKGKKDSVDTICNQMNHYREEGMPRHYGLFACGCIIRKNNQENMKKIMRSWWNEVYAYSYRDQLSFTYVLWKNNIMTKEIGLLGENIYESCFFCFNKNHQSNHNFSQIV